SDWFPAFRRTVEGMSGNAGDQVFVCHQIYMAQAAIFHDSEEFDWAAHRLLTLLTPASLQSSAALECAALLAGVFNTPMHEERRAQIAVRLDPLVKENASAREARAAIGSIIVQTSSDSPSVGLAAMGGPSTSRSMVPKDA